MTDTIDIKTPAEARAAAAEKAAADNERYRAALQAVQAGAATEIGLNHPTFHPELQRAFKHLRVGIDSAKVEQAALVALLIQRGILTEGDYVGAIADGMEQEKARWEAMLSARLNTKITLA